MGRKISTPKEFDDPAVVCSNLMNELKLLGFAPPSFSITKLHKGYGLEVPNAHRSRLNMRSGLQRTRCFIGPGPDTPSVQIPIPHLCDRYVCPAFDFDFVDVLMQGRDGR